MSTAYPSKHGPVLNFGHSGHTPIIYLIDRFCKCPPPPTVPGDASQVSAPSHKQSLLISFEYSLLCIHVTVVNLALTTYRIVVIKTFPSWCSLYVMSLRSVLMVWSAVFLLLIAGCSDSSGSSDGVPPSDKDLPASAVGVSAGLAHSMALTKDGAVYTWGSDVFGTLGKTTGGEQTAHPTHTTHLPTVTEVAAGATQSLALTEDGDVYAIGGSGTAAQQDPTAEKRPERPARVPHLPTVSKIAAGTAHSLALAKDGHVYAWGGNEEGESVGDHPKIREKPVRVPGLANVTHIAAGGNHSLATTDDGTTYATGRDLYSAPAEAPEDD